MKFNFFCEMRRLYSEFIGSISRLFLFFCIFYGFFSFSEPLFSPIKKYKAFLAHQSRQRHFSAQRKAILQQRLKELKQVRRQKSHFQQKQKSFLAHQSRQRLFEMTRKKALFVYKKQHKEHQQRRRIILARRLKALKAWRRQNRKIEKLFL